MYLTRFTDAPFDGDCEVVRRIQDPWLSSTFLWLCTSLLFSVPICPQMLQPCDGLSNLSGAREKWALGQHPTCQEANDHCVPWEESFSQGALLALHCAAQREGQHSQIKLYFLPSSMCLFSDFLLHWVAGLSGSTNKLSSVGGCQNECFCGGSGLQTSLMPSC